MTFRQIVRKIKADTWWSEESPANYQQTLGAWRAFILQRRMYGPRFLSICVALFRNDFLYEKTSEQEKLAQFYLVLRRYRRNPKTIQARYRAFYQHRQRFIELGERALLHIRRINNRALATLYEQFYDAYTTFFTHATMPEAVDIYTDQRLLSDFQKSVGGGVASAALPEFATILATYPMRSFMEEERLEFLRLCLKKNPAFEVFSRKYRWIQNNYLGAKNLTPDYFHRTRMTLLREKTRNEIQAEIHTLEAKPRKLVNKQAQLIRQLRVPSSTRKIFSFLRLIGRWIDERKYGALHGIEYIDAFLSEVSRRTNIHHRLLSYYTPEETVKLLRAGTTVPARELTVRRRLSAYVVSRKGKTFEEHIITGNRAQRLFTLFTPKKSSTLHGFVASAPVKTFRGRVHVVLNPHAERFPTGKILVTTMTRPDFVPLMRRASAIITDEGGITSHAAIVSRELKIPCIIGTKIATKTLKNGDRVEVDAVKGIVKKIRARRSLS